MARCIPPSAVEKAKDKKTQPRSKTSQLLKSVISLVLCASMLVSFISPEIVWAAGEALAQQPSANVSEQEQSPAENTTEDLFGGAVDLQDMSDSEITGELSDLRDENTKYFRLTDGTTVAAIYDSPVHRMDAAGKWQNIDNSLSDTGNEYENQSGFMRVKFSKKPKNGKLYTLKAEDGQIKWSLLGAVDESKSAKLSQRLEKSSKLSVKSTSESITYEDILPGVTLQYWITESGIKENIIFANAQSATPLQFEIQTNKFDVTLENNTLYFKNSEGETAFAMSAPWMMDNAGIHSEDITLSLSGSKNHYQVTITPDADWLKTATYPVTVDPILSNVLLGQNNSNNSPTITNTYVVSKSPDEVAGLNYGSVVVGRQSGNYENCRGVYKFDLPDNLTSAHRVIAANLQLSVLDFQPAQSNLTVTVNAHKITSDLAISSLTWNKLDGKYSSVIGDSQVISLAHKASGSTVPRIPFDITKIVRDWCENGSNYGLVLTSDNENGAYKYVSLFTGNHTNATTSRLPSLIIQYADARGLEDNFTYHSAGNADMGTVSVNDFNGNLVYTIDDVSTNGNLFPVSISHVFDNSYRSEERPEHSSGYVGDGFRLNLYERILDCDIDGYPYKYLDPDGTWHYFKVKDTAANTYVDEFYPNRIIKRYNNADGSPQYFILSDGSDIESRFTWNGYLTYKRNTSNNKVADIHFVGNTAHIDKVTDGAGKTIQFSYVTIYGKQYLRTMTDPAGRVTTFTYTGTRLTSVTRPGDKWIFFSYDSNGCLTKVKNYDNYSINLTYNTAKYNSTKSLLRVKTITEVGTNSATEGGRLTFSYGQGETTVTDRAGRTETMMFDDFGQTVCVRDNAGRASFLKYSSFDANRDINPNKTNNSENSKARATQLSYTTKMQATVNNFVANPDFEDSSLGAWHFENSTNAGTGSAALTSEQAYRGNNSLKIQCSSIDKRYGYEQGLSLPSLTAGKTYTISSYVKITDLTTSASSSISGAIVYFGFQYADGSWDIRASEALQTLGEWTRISRTFTLPENITKMIAKIGLYNCTGTAYFDNVQVEEGSIANNYNLIENGYFGDADNTTVPSAFVTSGLSPSTDMVTSDIRGNRYFKIEGGRTSYKNVEQIVTTSGKKGDKFSFSAWAKSTGALSRNGSLTAEDRNFEVRIMFVDSSGNWYRHYFPFESKSTGWQMLAGEVVANTDYVAVRMAVIYNNQKNIALVDNFCLFEEGSNIRYTYDDWGRVTKIYDITDKGDKTTIYTYEVAYTDNTSVMPDGRIKNITYPDGTTEAYTYDSAKRVKTHTDANGVRTTYNYDSVGNLLGTTVTEAGTTGGTALVGSTTAYTSNGNYATSTTDPFGKTTSMVVNETKGLVNSVTDPKGTVTSYTYDANTDALEKTQSGSSYVDYGYENHKLSSITHSGQNNTSTTYKFFYDKLNRVSQITVGSDFRLVSNVYDTQTQNLSTVAYGNGLKLDYSYDDLDRVTGVSYNDTERYNWEYNYKGQVGLHRDLENNQEFRYTYDSKGRVESVVSKPTATGFSRTEFKNVFNSKDQLTSVTRKIAGATLKANYNYSSGGRLTSEEFYNHSTQNYGYDTLGRVGTKTLKNSSGSSVLSQSYAFAAGTAANTTTSRISTETISGNGWSQTFAYTYDNNGNVTKITKNGETYATYSYDSLNQLTFAYVNGIGHEYSYDNGGNMIYKYIGGNEYFLEYNESGWKDLVSTYNEEPFLYDEMGNLEYYRDGMYDLGWEGRRLKIITGTSGGTSRYAYNSDGIRTKKTVGSNTTYYTLDGTKIIRQKTGNTEIFFEYDATGNVATMIYGGKTYYYVRNMLGEILGLADQSGNLVVTYTYDPWGKILNVTDTTSNNIGTLNPFRYKGYYYDTESGFYYLNSRYYDPELCKFLSADGYISTGQGILGTNMVAYCGNNPVNRVDPTGMFWKEIGDFFSNAWNGIKTWAKNTFGAGSSTTATIAEIETPVIPDPSPITVKTGTKTTQTISKHGDSSKPISVYKNKDMQQPVISTSFGININVDDFTLNLNAALDNIGIYGSLANGNTTDSFGVKLNLSEFKIGFEGSTTIQWDNTTEITYENVSVNGFAIVAAYILVTTGQYVQSPSYAYSY